MGVRMTAFRGLLPGMLGNISNINPMQIFQSFMSGTNPKCQMITMQTVDNNNRKNQRMIDFPLENLDMRKYIVGYDKESYMYDLYGICNHSGGSAGGHYTSYVKNANNKWYHFNDTNCNEINLGGLKTPLAYCFFYRKQKK